jgi:hypothetical protein
MWLNKSTISFLTTESSKGIKKSSIIFVQTNDEVSNLYEKNIDIAI